MQLLETIKIQVQNYLETCFLLQFITLYQFATKLEHNIFCKNVMETLKGAKFSYNTRSSKNVNKCEK